ncbi:MAG: hypothetical protein LUE20_07265 [Oscillospiraceae bacterium]|nr:hypothetical protein [Oscillospiraceae bacterium]
MKVNVIGGELSQEEISQYVSRAESINKGKVIDEMTLRPDGDYIDIEYHFAPANFERIRRITGYLVGTLDRFNNAKRAEVGDRVKHSVA